MNYVVSQQILALRRRILRAFCFLGLDCELRALVQDFDSKALTSFLRSPAVVRQAIILECKADGKHPCQRYEKDSSPSIWLTGVLSNYRRTIDTIVAKCKGNSPSFQDPEALRQYSKQFVNRTHGFNDIPADQPSARRSTGFKAGSHFCAPRHGRNAGPVPGSSTSSNFDIESISPEDWNAQHSWLFPDVGVPVAAASVPMTRLAESPSAVSLEGEAAPRAAMSVGSTLPQPPPRGFESAQSLPPMPLRPAVLEGVPRFIIDEELLVMIRGHTTSIVHGRLASLASRGVRDDPRFESDDVGDQLAAVVEVLLGVCPVLCSVLLCRLRARMLTTTRRLLQPFGVESWSSSVGMSWSLHWVLRLTGPKFAKPHPASLVVQTGSSHCWRRVRRMICAQRFCLQGMMQRLRQDIAQTCSDRLALKARFGHGSR